MNLLRATLRWQAALWAISGIALVGAPGWFVEVVMDQPPADQDAWLRIAGVMALALAGQMVLVGRRIEELWWWAWTFVLLEIGTTAVVVVSGLTGLPEGAALWPWLALAVVNAGFAALEVAALAKAGTERSAV